GQGTGRDAYRSGSDCALPMSACGLQGAEGGPLPRFIAEIRRRKNPAQGSARAAIGGTMAMAQYSLASAPRFVGRELGASEWVTVDQDRIDAFAACPGDRRGIPGAAG